MEMDDLGLIADEALALIRDCADKIERLAEHGPQAAAATQTIMLARAMREGEARLRSRRRIMSRQAEMPAVRLWL
jgi:hypothetical protein